MSTPASIHAIGATSRGNPLKPVKSPDVIEDIRIDYRTLPKGQYQAHGFDVRQVIDFSITTRIVEYRAEKLIDQQGNLFVADFPEWVTRLVLTLVDHLQLLKFDPLGQQGLNVINWLTWGSTFFTHAASLRASTKKRLTPAITSAYPSIV